MTHIFKTRVSTGVLLHFHGDIHYQNSGIIPKRHPGDTYTQICFLSYLMNVLQWDIKGVKGS